MTGTTARRAGYEVGRVTKSVRFCDWPATGSAENSNPSRLLTLVRRSRSYLGTVRIGTAPACTLWVPSPLRTNRQLRRRFAPNGASQRRIKMKLMKVSLVSTAFLLGLLVAGCNTAPAAGPAGPQGPPGPQGASDRNSDHDRDRDRDADRDRQDQGRRDDASSCPAGEHRDGDRGCVRN